MEESGRTLGTVQWFSRVKGYGFIRPDDGEEDVFVHYSVIRGEGYRNLDKGQRVEFTIEDSPKGPQAVDVIGLEALDAEVGLGTGLDMEEVGPVDVVRLEALDTEVGSGTGLDKEKVAEPAEF